jgi:cytochrome c-type biogenesis protein CcmH/NrfF
MVSRREFLRRAAFAGVPVGLAMRGMQDPRAGQGKPPRPDSSAIAADTLALPVGAIATLGPLDNDPGVIGIERRLRCSCGCTLDVYTCRTTDFSCTFSPAMHRKVVEQVQAGATPEQVVDWFVAQPEYGEKVLMSPNASGFNLAGYLVPGLSIAAVGLALVAWLTRRSAASEPPGAQAPVPPPAPGDEQMQRLRRALDDVES